MTLFAGQFAAKYGLSAAKLGENFEKSFTRHNVETYPFSPDETASDYVKAGGVFPDRETVIRGGDYMVAKELSRDPQLRKAIRKMYFERAKVGADLQSVIQRAYYRSQSIRRNRA